MQKSSSLFPIEKVLFFQRVICTLLVALMLIFSFGPLFVVPFDDDFNEFFYSLDSEEDVDFEQSKASLSFDFSASALALPELFTLSSARATERSDIYHSVAGGEKLDVTTRASGIAYLLTEAYEADFTVALYLTLLYALTLIIPMVILLAFIFICSRYGPFASKKDGHLLYKGVMRNVRRIVCLMPISVLLIAIAPKVRFGFSGMTIFIACMIALLFSAIAPHFKAYTKVQKKYILMLQCVSLLGIGFFAVFCISLVRSHAMPRFVALFNNLNPSQLFSIFKGGNFDMDEIISILSGILILAGLYATCRSPKFNLCRIGLMTTRMKKRDYTRGDAYISKTILPNIIIIVYLLLIDSTSAIAVYKGEEIYFFLLMASLVLMTVTEIMIVVLGSTLCMDLGSAGRDVVLEGTIYEAQIENRKMKSGFFSRKKEKNRNV